MASYVEIVAWLVFASFAAAVVGYVGLLVWAGARAIFATRADIEPPRQVPTASELVLRASFFRVGAIWISLLVLVPLLVLALWAVAEDLRAGRIGGGLVFTIVHSCLLWQFVRLGTHVQREIVLSSGTLNVRPVFGAGHEIAWTAVELVRDITYVGPAVSGLYIYTSDGEHFVLDRGLPHWDWLRATVRELTPSASWRTESRAAIG